MLFRSPPRDDRAAAAWLYRLLDLLRPRAKRLPDLVEQARPFLSDTVEFEPGAMEKHVSAEIGDHVAALVAALRDLTPFDEPHVEKVVRGTAEGRGIKGGALIHAVRVGITGRTASPGIFESLVLLGPARSLLRLERLLSLVRAR